ncbi:RimK family alpha-L-glutamate ligase [Streptomyces qinglanensis]|uniref:RimK family alpha-L-glutamate ligase n=1 Tax=Streptomyces qinglanensis TaxID=943816 RepID=UPI0037A5F2CF
MRVVLITPRPDHPLLAAATALLRPDHRVEVIDPATAAAAPQCAEPERPLADVYLLKARTPRALALAHALERHGAVVVNSAAATARCQDRTRMAGLAHRAGLPFVRGRTVGALRELAGLQPTRPLVVKSRYSRRGDLVARVDGAREIRALCGIWGSEPVVVQPFAANDGWDRKLWVISGQLFAGLRRSELAEDSPAGPAGREPAEPLAPGDLPRDWYDLALRTGAAFGLEVYGLDLVDGGGGPLIVDVNAFPGIRGQAGAPRALAELVLRKGAAARSATGAERSPGR